MSGMADLFAASIAVSSRQIDRIALPSKSPALTPSPLLVASSVVLRGSLQPNLRKSPSAPVPAPARRGPALEVNFQQQPDALPRCAAKHADDPSLPPLADNFIYPRDTPSLLFSSHAVDLCARIAKPELADTSSAQSNPTPGIGSASGSSEADIAARRLADYDRSANMVASSDAGVAATPTKKTGGGLFGKFSAKKDAGKDASKAAAAAPAPAPVIRDLHPLPLPSDLNPPSPALSGGNASSVASSRAHTLSTASTLAMHPTAGAPLGIVATASSGGSSGIEAKQSPVPSFGSQRKLFFPITVLAAPVQKKAFAMLPSSQDAHSQAAMSMFANSKGDWKKRVITISTWTAQTANPSPVSGEDESVSFGWLHIFKQDGPSGKEVGRMRIGWNSVVGLLDPSTREGEQAEGRKHVLSFTAGKKAKKAGVKRVKEIFGEAEDKLIVQMESEESLQQWISEIKGLILVKRAEMRGIGNAARALKDRGDALSGDLDILIGNLVATEAKKHAGRRPSAASVASTETSGSGAPSARIVVPPTVIEARESSPSPEPRPGDDDDESGGGAAAAMQPRGSNSAQAAALATDSLELLLTTARNLPTSATSSSLGSSRTTDAPASTRPDDTSSVSPTALSPLGRQLPQLQLEPASARTSLQPNPPAPMPTELSYSYTFDAKQSPLPAVGCLRAALIPITVLSAEVDKRVRCAPPSSSSGGGAHTTAGLALFSSSKPKQGEWKRRHLVLTSWSAVTAEAAVARTSFSCLHVFDKAGPSAKELGRMKLHASSLVGWLDSSAANGQEADGRKFVLSVIHQSKGSRAAAGADVWGEIDERLLVSMLDESTLKQWISELKKMAFIKRAETKGLGDQARGAQGKSFGDDLDHALHLLSESSLDTASRGRTDSPRTPSGAPVLEFSGSTGHLRPNEPTRQVDSVGERSEVSMSDHSSYQMTFDSGGTRSTSVSSFAAQLREPASAPLSRDLSASSMYITRPVLVASSNNDLAHLVQPAHTLPSPRDTDDFRGGSRPTAATSRTSDYTAFEAMLSQRLHPHSPMSDRFSTAGDSTRTFATSSSAAAAPEPEPVDSHRAEIERLKRVEAELRSQLEIERLRAVEAELRGQLEQQRQRREDDERRRQQIEAKRRDRTHGHAEQLIGPKDDISSDDSDVDPRGPTPRSKRALSSVGRADMARSSASSTYSGYSARDSFAGQSDASSFQGYDRSAWDTASGRQDRQGSNTTVGSSVYSDKEQLRSSPLSPPVAINLSRRASSRVSSGPPTPVDEESSSRSSFVGPRPSSLAPDYGGSSSTLSSPSHARHYKLAPGTAAPPPSLSLPPPPYGGPTSVEMGRKLSDPGSQDSASRAYVRRPSAGLETLNERPSGSGRSRAAMLRQASVPLGTPPPSSGLPPTPL